MDMITSGNFNLTFKGLRHYWHDRDILSRKKEVYVYTTESTDLNSIDIKLTSGTINIADYKASFDVMANVAEGNIKVKASEANSFNLSGDNTVITVENVKAPRFHSDLVSGKIIMRDCEIDQMTQLSVKESGEVDLQLPLAASEYNVTAYASKSVTYNGKNVGTQYPPQSAEGDTTQNTGNKTIDVNVVSGTVSIKTK